MDPMLLEQLIPLWPGLITLIGFFVVGAFAIWNRKRGNVENRAPSTAESWREADRARKVLRTIEDAYWELRAGWQAYYRRVQSGGTPDLNTKEHRLINAQIPDDDAF